jgi:hypothetical protein
MSSTMSIKFPLGTDEAERFLAWVRECTDEDPSYMERRHLFQFFQLWRALEDRA